MHGRAAAIERLTFLILNGLNLMVMNVFVGLTYHQKVATPHDGRRSMAQVEHSMSRYSGRFAD
jgi:hypothetical protein